MTYNYYSKIILPALFFLISVVVFFGAIPTTINIFTNLDQPDYTFVHLLSAAAVVLFSAYAAYVMGKRIVNRILKKPILIIDSNGITDRTSAIVSEQPIRWSQLAGVSYFEMSQGASKQKFIGLLFKNPEEIQQLLSPTKFKLNQQSQRLIGGEGYLFITLASVDAKSGKILEAIKEASNNTVLPTNVTLQSDQQV